MILPQRTWMSESERIANLSPRICKNERCGNKARYPLEECEVCIELDRVKDTEAFEN